MAAAPVRSSGPVRLAYLVSHPIQYQAPLLRRIALEPDIDLTVFFGSDFSLRSYRDEGFGVGVEWDVPLVDGYSHEFLPVIRDNATVSVTRPLNHGIFSRLRGQNGEAAFDALWIHGYASLNSMQAMVAAKALGIPVLLRADIWLKDRPRGRSRLLAKHAFFSVLRTLIDAVLPIGTFNSQYWTHYLGPEFPQFLMPYAVDNSFFERRTAEASATRAELRAELDLEPGRPVILFASKLQQRKQCDHLIEAFARLCEQGRAYARPYLVIVGDGEMRPQLEAQAETSGLDDVRFCGFRNQSELPRFFDLASVFVLPSRHEPWGLIVNEVMNARRAVIVSDDCGCYPDLITDGVEGVVFPVGDVAALTDALARVLAFEEIAEKMGESAFRRIQRSSLDANVEGLRHALSALTGRLIA